MVHSGTSSLHIFGMHLLFISRICCVAGERVSKFIRSHPQTVKAYIDASGAKALFAGYEYAPRNAENVAIQTTNAEPLVDYNQMQAIMQGAIALTEDYAQIAAQNTQK